MKFVIGIAFFPCTHPHNTFTLSLDALYLFLFVVACFGSIYIPKVLYCPFGRPSCAPMSISIYCVLSPYATLRLSVISFVRFHSRLFIHKSANSHGCYVKQFSFSGCLLWYWLILCFFCSSSSYDFAKRIIYITPPLILSALPLYCVWNARISLVRSFVCICVSSLFNRCEHIDFVAVVVAITSTFIYHAESECSMWDARMHAHGCRLY